MMPNSRRAAQPRKTDRFFIKSPSSPLPPFLPTSPPPLRKEKIKKSQFFTLDKIYIRKVLNEEFPGAVDSKTLVDD